MVKYVISQSALFMSHYTQQVSIAFHKPYLDLIERLLPIMPHPSLDTFFFWNSGSEAIEAAVKLARTKTKKQNIIVMQGEDSRQRGHLR